MKRIKKFLILILVMALIIASIPIIFIIISNTQEQENIHIEFLPKRMKSYPNHTA